MHTPLLRKLMGAYFHEDWVDDGDEESTVRLFLAEQPDSVEIVTEIDGLLSDMPAENDLEDYLLELGTCYVPGTDEGGYRGWLASIATRAQDYKRGGTAS